MVRKNSLNVLLNLRIQFYMIYSETKPTNEINHFIKVSSCLALHYYLRTLKQANQ